jgi:hypothetical protein
VTSSDRPIDPALDEQIGDHPDRKVPVVVVFTQPRSPEELDELGLYAASPGPSPIAYGEQDGPAIRALGERDDVATVSAAPVLPARPDPDEAPPSATSGKISSDLAMQLYLQPAASQLVIVTFSSPPGTDAMVDLGLSEAGPTMGSGTLEPAAIRRLAERPDVLQVSWSPPPRLLNLD